jgi:CO/xanthine dehydrogenase FAD-binding subunit
MQIREDELLTRIRLPRTTQPLKHYYRKVGTRKAQAISKVCFAAVARTDGRRIDELRIALGSIAPVPLRCVRTEDVLRGQEIDQAVIASGKEALAREIAPIDDIRSTKNYRLRISQNLLADFLENIAAAS